MAKSLDKVLQADGTYKWELVEPDLSERMGNGVKAPAACPAPEPAVETEVVNQKDFTAMTKSELEEFGRTIGIELDKRHTKVALISELETFIESK